MIQRPSSLNNCQNPCRPLITTSYQLLKVKNELPVCIDLPYNYLLNDIKNLQTYLCSSSVQIVGVDFMEKPQPIPKLKYKNVLIGGYGLKSQKIQFNSQNKYENFSWIVDVITTYPQYSHQPKQQLKKHFQKNIHILNQSLQLEINPLISIQKLRKSKLHCTIKRQKNKKKQKLFICRIPIGIILPILPSYEIQSILTIICQDISNAVHIMISNSLMHRVVKYHMSIIPLQNYYQNQQLSKEQKDRIFNKFYLEPTIKTSMQEKTNFKNKKDEENNQLIINDKKQRLNLSILENKSEGKLKLQTKNKDKVNNGHLGEASILILLLIILIGIYAYIKLS